MKPIKTVPLNQNVENRLLEFMNQDKISHFYAIHNLQHLREKTQCWVALSNNRVEGYLMEYDKRILYMRGHKKCTVPLLRSSNLATPMFNIELKHFSAVKKLYEPTEPADKMTIGQITIFKTMKATPESFTPVIRHRVQELNSETSQALGELLGVDAQVALNLFTGFAFGVFKRNKLVSFAASPEMLQDLAIIRGVQTAPEERNKGYATSACSALVQRLHQQGRDVMLYVSRDNPAAIKVYEKIGFKETGHIFLGFVARKKPESRLVKSQRDS